MADDDIEINEEVADDFEEEVEEEVDLELIEPEIDGDEIDDDVVLDEDDDFVADADDEVVEVDEDETGEDDEKTARARKRKGTEEDDDDDDDVIAPDDVEADLDAILRDRMVSSADADAEDEDEDDQQGKASGDNPDGLQPKRADETLCSNCFLLVRPTAHGCPVEDDTCPIFG